jgi:hypothetical protein
MYSIKTPAKSFVTKNATRHNVRGFRENYFKGVQEI